MAEPHVVTIILNNNRRDDTLACLASLAQGVYKNHSMIVLDNGSSDGSVEAIGASFSAVEIIELTENLGYAGNNNVGLEAILSRPVDWVFVLNDDTIVDSDCITRLIEVGESDEQIGIVGPMVYHHDEPNVIQSAGGKLGRYWESWHIGQNEPDQGQFVQPHPVDWISGCAILLRRAVIEEVGLLDERFFCYWEEIDWCLRASKAGWHIMHVPQAKLWHKGVQRDYRPKPWVTYYSTRNHFLLLAKHRAPLVAWLITWGQTLRTLISWTIKPKWRSMNGHRNAMWWGMLDFLRNRLGQNPSC
jgi:GT2 family glycosyltransferase